jgi:hypothetical protein
MSAKFIRRRLTVFIPAALKEITGAVNEEKKRVLLTGAFDEDKSTSAAMHRELRALIDDYMVGFGAGPSETIKYQRNRFTGDILTNDSWPWNPFTLKPAQPEPWATEIQRLKGAGLDRLPNWMGKPQPADIGISTPAVPTAPGIRLTGHELDRWEVLMTQVVKDRHGKYTESLNALVTSDIYLRQSDVTKRKMIQELDGEFQKRAQEQLLRENKALKNAFLLRVGESQIEHLPEARQPSARERIQRRYGPGVAP